MCSSRVGPTNPLFSFAYGELSDVQQQQQEAKSRRTAEESRTTCECDALTIVRD